MVMTAPRVDEARLPEPGRWWGSSPTSFATSTSTCSISLARVVRRCAIGNDNVPNVLVILSTTTVNALSLAILRGGSGQTPLHRPAHRPVPGPMARKARRWASVKTRRPALPPQPSPAHLIPALGSRSAGPLSRSAVTRLPYRAIAACDS